MSDTRNYIQALFANKKMDIPRNRESFFDEFIKDETNIMAVTSIIQHQQALMDKWKLNLRIKDIIDQQLVIPNAMVGKEYKAQLDLVKAGYADVIYTEFEGLEAYGLFYDRDAEIIHGTPTESGDFKIKLRFRIKGEKEDSELNTKSVSLVINADPKSLWKDLPSVQTGDNFWKPDKVSEFASLGDKHIVVASTRGRSHANVASFRDDDYAFKQLQKTGWSVVCVADGAGSAPFSREGSRVACNAVIEYLESDVSVESFVEFDNEIINHHIKNDEETSNKISIAIYEKLSKAAYHAFKKIEEAANKSETQMSKFNSTLIFALYKKYDFGYVIMSFGVGDCPIGLLSKDFKELKLMNWLDVGDFGGGTRFITMPEIFSSDKFSTRFGFKIVEDFEYLMLMTDGIYDAKFVVEANLEKMENWKQFLRDLAGENEEKITVELNNNNPDIATQLSKWMDFWSAGNHDDRTLAIVF